MRLINLIGKNRRRLLVLASACGFTMRGGLGCGVLGFVFPEPVLKWNAFCPQRLLGEWKGGKGFKNSYGPSLDLCCLDNSCDGGICNSIYAPITSRKRKGYLPGLSAFMLPYGDQISDSGMYSSHHNSLHFFSGTRGKMRLIGRQARDAWWWVRRHGISIALATVLVITVMFSFPEPSRAGLFDLFEDDIYVNSPRKVMMPKIPENLESQLRESTTDCGKIFLEPDDYEARELVKATLQDPNVDMTNYRIPGDEKILEPMHIATKDFKHTPVEDIVYEKLWRETSGLSGMCETSKIPTIVKTLIAIPICTAVLVKVVMFFVEFANEIAEEEEIELYGKVVPVSAIEKPTPPEGEDYEWADENDWAPPVHDNEDGGTEDWPLPDGPESWDGPRGSDSNLGDVSEDDLLS